MNEGNEGLDNGHNTRSAAQAALGRNNHTPPGLPGISARRQAVEARPGGYQSLHGVAAEIHTGMFEHGYRRAVDGGVLESRSDDVEAIKLHAAKAARECDRDLFDERVHLHDRMYMDEHEKHLADRHEEEQAEKFAYVEMRERAAEAAKVKAGPPPKKGAWIALGVVGAIALAISFVVTFHDVFFPMPDELLSWFVSFVAATIIGAVIATMIIADTGSDGERSTMNWIGLAGGVLIAAGFAAARLRDATTTGEYYFTLALLVFELGIVIGLEGVATRLRAANREYAIRLAAERQAGALLEEATGHHQHCQQRVRDFDSAVKGDIGYVEERHLRYFRIDDLEAAMVAAGLDGYNAGIAENRGLVRRAKRRS